MCVKTVRANQIILLIDKKLWKPVVDLKDRKFLKYKYLVTNSNRPDFIEREGFPFIYVIEDKDEIKYVKIGTGIIRQASIFYTIQKKMVYVADNVYRLLRLIKKFQAEPWSLIEFLSFGYVLTNRSLLRNIYTLEAGQVLEFKDGILRIFDQFIYDFTPVAKIEENDLMEKLWNISLTVFKDVVSSIKGTIFVPLSAGFDSRFVVGMLKLLNAKDVICINYGVKKSYEMPTSKKVADKLGYDWLFIEYSGRNLLQLVRSGKIFDYVKMVSQYHVTPNIQELLSTFVLKEKYGYENLTFIPGHTGDFISGGHISKSAICASNLKDLAESIIRKHLLRNYPGPNQLLRDVISYVNGYLKKAQGKLASYQLYEIFDWRERQSKYIISSSKPYEHFGFSYSLPLWDKRFFDFWSSVPLNFKYNKKLYKQFLGEYIFAPLGIDFERTAKQAYSLLNMTRRVMGNLLGRMGFGGANPCGFDIIFPYLKQYYENRHPQPFCKLSRIKKRYGIKGYVEPAAYMNDLTAALMINDLRQNFNCHIG